MADSNITKNALANALKSLLEEMPFQKISVSDICARCDMNRKSFYYHLETLALAQHYGLPTRLLDVSEDGVFHYAARQSLPTD